MRFTLAAFETVRKCHDRRAALESMFGKSGQIFSSVGSTLTVQRVEEVCDGVMQADMLRHEDVSLHVGCMSVSLMMASFLLHWHTRRQSMFSRVMELYSRVMPVSHR